MGLFQLVQLVHVKQLVKPQKHQHKTAHHIWFITTKIAKTYCSWTD